MRHSAKTYARAFAEVASGKLQPEQEKRIVENFAALVQRNGDGAKWNAILAESAKLLREKEGLRKVTVESARPLTDALRKKLNTFIKWDDIVEEKIDASLVAGVRITLNDEEQFDASLGRKLQKMFA